MANLLPDESVTFVTICKKAFKPLYDEQDEVLISNLRALRKGLDALKAEDASDDERAQTRWTEAEMILQREAENEDSAASEGVVQVEDDFAMKETAYGI